jgi:hypothetical protein
MTEHPITPPPELVQQWVTATESNDCIGAFPTDFEQRICTAAAQWGSDQELEACCELVPGLTNYLRAARRPKPPSLKEQALDSFEFIGKCHVIAGPDWANIRRALEALPDV